MANINHSKLKENVESHLISIGEQLGLVNQLISYSPTEKMVEAVALLYSSFAKFLGKDLRCYAKSKPATFIEAFAFPWEAKFQTIVTQMNLQFRRIQELASVNHFHATLQNQNILISIRDSQQRDRAHVHAEHGSEHFRQEMREEMKELFMTFHAKWLQRFDELQAQQITAPDTATGLVNPSCPIVSMASMPQVYLADHVSKSEDLIRYRDLCFPQIQYFDKREDYIRASNRRSTTSDDQHCLALMMHPDMRAWMTTGGSSLIWVNSYLESRSTDWTTAFATHLVDDLADQ